MLKEERKAKRLQKGKEKKRGGGERRVSYTTFVGRAWKVVYFLEMENGGAARVGGRGVSRVVGRVRTDSRLGTKFKMTLKNSYIKSNR